MELIKYRSWAWLNTKLNTFWASIFEWYSNPILCLKCIWFKSIMILFVGDFVLVWHLIVYNVIVF